MVYTFDLKNKIVILTGGYGYLGKAIAESLLYHNAVVYILGRDNQKFTAAFRDIQINKSQLHFWRWTWRPGRWPTTRTWRQGRTGTKGS